MCMSNHSIDEIQMCLCLNHLSILIERAKLVSTLEDQPRMKRAPIFIRMMFVNDEFVNIRN